MARLDTVPVLASQVSGNTREDWVRNRCIVSQALSGALPSPRGAPSEIPARAGFSRRAHGLQLRALVRLRPTTMRGFTLVEMMIVVTIIAVISALVLPSMTSSIRDAHTQQAAIAAFDIVREARSRAMYRGVAHSLVLDSASGTLQMNVYEGTSSSCRLSRFGAGLFDPAQRVYSLDFGAATYTRGGISAEVRGASPLTRLQICFTPLGVAYFAAPAGSLIADATTSPFTWSNNPSSSGGVGSASFTIHVYRGTFTSPTGVIRQVVIPLSGMPRMRP